MEPRVQRQLVKPLDLGGRQTYGSRHDDDDEDEDMLVLSLERIRFFLIK